MSGPTGKLFTYDNRHETQLRLSFGNVVEIPMHCKDESHDCFFWAQQLKFAQLVFFERHAIYGDSDCQLRWLWRLKHVLAKILHLGF